MSFIDHYFFVSLKQEQLDDYRRRFYLGSALLAFYRVYRMGEAQPLSLFNPIGFFKFFPVPMPDKTSMMFLFAAVAIFSLLSIRKAANLERMTTFLLAFYSYGGQYNYGIMHSWDASIVIALGVMAFANPNESWSLRFIGFYWVLVIFLAGVNKLYNTGWLWPQSDPIGAFFMEQQYKAYPKVYPMGESKRFLISSGFSVLGAWFAMLVELASPLLLFSRRFFHLLYWPILILFFLILIIMGRNFFISMAPLYIACLPRYWPEGFNSFSGK